MTTSRALIADSRRASRGRVEKSVTAMDGQRTAGAGSCLTQRARSAPITSRNRTEQEQERRINRKRGTACCRTLFPQDQRVTGHGRVVLITQRSLVQIQPPQPTSDSSFEASVLAWPAPCATDGACHRDCHSRGVTGRNWPPFSATSAAGPSKSK